MTLDQHKLGARIRNRRREIDKTLKEVSEEVGVTASFLSMVERGKANMALNTLKQLADALMVPVLYFLSENWNEGKRDNLFTNHEEGIARNVDYPPLMKVDERPKLTLPASGVELQLLTHTLTQNLAAFISRLSPGKELPAHRYARSCEEFRYLLSGSLMVKLNSGEFIMNRGDTIHFPCSGFQGEKCLSQDEDAVWISVVSPPII